jgi:UDP-N-acetylglucosamine--N-acetylmuramyl-(pentapeptide) pyrophosphoryl-undecaprenol N-acetylglucosamine transferase
MATTSDVALAHLPRGKTRVVGYPVRGEFWTTDRAAARARLGLPAEAKVVVVTGASLGAARVNEAVARAHVLHITGPDKADEATAAREALPESLRDRYRIEEYFDDMAAAMHAADVVISRAGASTLGELPAAGAASILVPGEYEGWSQAPNAEFLQEAGAAVMLRNAELDRLGDTVLALLDDEQRRERMREAARTLARPNAADDLARLVMEVAA